MKTSPFVVALFLVLASAQSAHAFDSVWSRALPGDIVAGPLPFEDRVMLILSDRTITCISAQGEYLWRKNVGARPSPFFFVSSAGQVFSSSNGRIDSYSQDGYFLWRLGRVEISAFNIKEGKDGRLFIPLTDRVVCISPQGCIKWSRAIDGKITKELSETGDGDVLVFAGEKVIRMSPFGEILETRIPEEPLTVTVPIPGGYLAGSPSGTIRAYDVRNGRHVDGRYDTECVWTVRGSGSPVLAFSELNGTILAVYGDGSLHGYNRTDGVSLWSIASATGAVSQAQILNDYGQFTLSYSGGICAVTSDGRLLWKQSIPETDALPVGSSAGLFFSPAPNQVLNEWQPEVRIKTEKNLRKRENYGILNGQSSIYGIIGRTEIGGNESFFDEVSGAIAAGTVGANEVDYARRLLDIISAATGSDPELAGLAGIEQGRAASLLGQLGSSEYRDKLLAVAYWPLDDSAAIGVLYGIGASGADLSGESLAAIKTISGHAGSASDAVQKAACDALYAVIRYSAGKIAQDGTEILGRFLYEPYSVNVRNYARNILGNMLH